MNSRLLKRFGTVALLVFAGALMLLIGHGPAVGKDDEGVHRRLAGTWNVTLKFPVCSAACPCPGGVPNIPIPVLQTYLRDESLVEVGGSILFRGPSLGSWEHLGHHQFVARSKFFVFKSDGSGGPAANEVVTSHINVTGPDTFNAAATFDLFTPSGMVIAQGCAINETATRFAGPAEGDDKD